MKTFIIGQGKYEPIGISSSKRWKHSVMRMSLRSLGQNSNKKSKILLEVTHKYDALNLGHNRINKELPDEIQFPKLHFSCII